MKSIYLLLVVTIFSCSQVRLPNFGSKDKATLNEGWELYTKDDYANQLSSFEKSYINTLEDKELILNGKSKEYVEDLAVRILQNNELFFEAGGRPRVHVIKNAVPFHFSLPGRVIFLSTSLLNKYIKHEAILASVLSFELIRSDKFLYNKNIIIPTGHLPTERILSLIRIEVDVKIEIHKWAYYSIRRTGFDGEYYLSWLQTINRNTADFIPLLGDASIISREEAMFKAFLVTRSKSEDDRLSSKKESSKEFYQFLFYVKDHSA